MRITHVITGLEVGGAEAMLEKLLHAARSETPHITNEVISLGGIGTIGARLIDAGFSVRALHLGLRPSAALALPRLVRWLREAGTESVVQTWMYHADLLGGVAARLAGNRRLAWNVRGALLEWDQFSSSTALIVRACAACSRALPLRIVTNSARAMRDHARCGYDATRFVVIPNGFDGERFQRRPGLRAALRHQWRIADDQVLIGLVARLDPAKDHANFIAMAAHVSQQMPEARFLLAGRDIPASREIAAALVMQGLRDRFVLQGQIEDIPAVMSALDVFCLSSRVEGFPNVLGEAMACETPTVSTDCGDSREVLADDRLVAPVGDSAALARCVLRVATLPASERRAMGSLQRQSVLQRFGIAEAWRRYLALYSELQ